MQRSIEGHSVVLLVVAHPDDEVMFFSPLLERLANKRIDIHLLSLSSGNADGIGAQRTIEFFNCGKIFGIHPNNIEIIEDASLQDGMKNVWPEEVVASIVLSKISRCKADLVISFDEYGVSHHPNHIAVYHGVKIALKSAMATKGMKIYGLKLVTKNILRKFLGPVDILLCFLLSEHFVHKFSPYYTIFGMIAHASQFVWYRKLFVIFSSYTYVNSFVPF